MRKHNTPEQKLQRKNAYWCLRNIAKLSHQEARVFRDYTDNKILMILNGVAKPIPKW
jgi:hypothetical protein